MIPDLDLHGVSLVEELILRSRISIDMMKRYPAMGSPCLQPLPTVIWGEMLPFGMVTLLNVEECGNPLNYCVAEAKEF